MSHVPRFLRGAGQSPCSHHLCATHVSNVSSREKFSCPVCQEISPVPEHGWKVDSVLKIVVETWRMQQESAHLRALSSSAATMCGCCEERPAVRRCVQCDGVLCEECEKSTHSKGFFKGHTLVNIGEESPETVDFAPRMVCPEHHEKLDFYCLVCRHAVCSHCLILGDHKDHEQTRIDQAVETGKDTLERWMTNMSTRISITEGLLENFRAAEQDIQRNAETQRETVNTEMDHLRELIETKRSQLLSKCALEEKQKRMQLQAMMTRVEGSRGEARNLTKRSEGLLSLDSEHAFLAVVLPLIQDMKNCDGRPVDDHQRVPTTFRPLSTDAQVRSLGDLDLGHPRVHQIAQPVFAGGTGMHMSQHGGFEGHHGAYAAVMHQQQQHQGYHGSSAATMPYVAPQPGVQQAQVQYVYRSAVPPA